VTPQSGQRYFDPQLKRTIEVLEIFRDGKQTLVRTRNLNGNPNRTSTMALERFNETAPSRALKPV
jgi:hypothetical protein